MDKDGILRVLEIVGAHKVRPFRGNVQLSCLLAEYRAGHSSGSDHADSMGISINPNGPSLVNCFACKYRGTLVSVLQTLSAKSGKDFKDLLVEVGEKETLSPQQILNSVLEYDSAPTVKEEVLLESRVLDAMQNGCDQSILDRGFKLEVLKEWEAKIDPKRKRTVFPVKNRKGALVGGIGRAFAPVTPLNPRYYNYWEFDKSRYLFGEDKVGEAEVCILVEGVLDTIAVWQELQVDGSPFGFPCASLGIMGSEMSDEQIRFVARKFKQVVFFFDNDPAGWTCTRKAASSLQKRLPVRFVQYDTPMGGDPTDHLKQPGKILEMIKGSSLLVL